MNYSENMYRRVYKTIESFSNRLNLLKQENKQFEESYSNGLVQIKIDVEERLRTNREQEARLMAFIGIAKAHATNLIDNGKIEAYNTGVLSRLAVQINNASNHDIFAEQLFTHASCQLRSVRTSVQQIDFWVEDQKCNLQQEITNKKSEVERKKSNLSNEMVSYLSSEEFRSFIHFLEVDSEKFGSNSNDSYEISGSSDEISIGTKRVILPIPDGYESLLARECGGVFDSVTKTVGVPAVINIKNGGGILAEYTNENENIVLKGVQNLIVNALRYGDEYDQILYIDPVRYNNSSLGILQPLSVGNNPVINSVPQTIDEVRKELDLLLTQIRIDNRKIANNEKNVMARRLLVLHNFPYAYDSTMVSQIQQLFVNANHYNVTIIATVNKTSERSFSSDEMALIKSVAMCINCNEQSFSVEEPYGKYAFKWYTSPSLLPQDVKIKYINEKAVLNTGNNYDDRIGLDSSSEYRKGIRRLENIPYGVDSDGNILTLDFENSNFASFICGASRSGKSTLLHTLITGFIKNNHPDDVEIWLIDFKMTEFSRYIEYLPPHVRYIILDESPELVYDIVDRLTEILIKRQNAFKGKWQKLNEVPKEKYMPAILVVIDEFSVMSQIIADSVASGKENYAVKLQALLAKGAALGLHFIFASQGFTSGTRGLNDFSKKQIQQRIAMKTEYSEIKDTLDLKSTSDEDRLMMEQLTVHHALVRIPVDDRGNHLKQTKVLYIDDYNKQEELIDKINLRVHTAPKYNVNDVNIYIDKKPMVIDGSNYTTFLTKRDSMLEYLNTHRHSFDGDEVALFLGEPRRMMPLYPITLNNGFCENILVVSPISESMATSSVMMSIAQSLGMVNKSIDVWADKKNKVYRQVVLESQQEVRKIYNSLGEICSQIAHIKSLIEKKIEGDKYIFILGTETIMMDMSYQTGRNAKEVKKQPSSNSSLHFEKRAPGEMDLNSLLASLSGGTASESTVSTSRVETIEPTIETETELFESSEYDARNDLKFIMTHGPKLGYHFIILFNTAGELNQSKMDISLCKHKVLFRMAKTDALDIVGSSNANVVVGLEDHSFRYSNGIDELSFRPYLHPGLSWDGWSMSEDSVENDEEEEYLM